MNAAPLYQASQKLKHLAPEQWREFVAAFDTYSRDILEGVLGAEPPELQKAQGSARQCFAIKRIFDNCDRPNIAPPRAAP